MKIAEMDELERVQFAVEHAAKKLLKSPYFSLLLKHLLQKYSIILLK